MIRIPFPQIKLTKIDGEAITSGLHAFNNWRDDFLIEASTLLLMIGFLMGTVDIYVRGGIATQGWFNVLWAIVQAIAIDGLFFAVWGKIARSQWKKGFILQNIAMLVVGLVLALVATLVNDILSYQQIRGIADSLTAMQALQINDITLTHTRAILVVTVAILVSLFCRGKGKATVSNETTKLDQATVTEVPSPSQLAIPEHSSNDHSPTAIASLPSAIEDSPNSPVSESHSLDLSPRSEDDSLAISESDSPTEETAIVALDSQGYREKIKTTWLRFISEGRTIKLMDIATEAGVGYSTVKKWAGGIRAEIEQERTEQVQPLRVIK